MDPHPLLRRIANRATTFAERLAAPDAPAGVTHDGLDGAAVIQAWRAAVAAPDDATFDARLSWQGLTVASALAAASRQVYATAPLPPWTVWLQRALDEGPHVADGLDRGLADVPQTPAIAEPPFVELGLPWLRVARQALARELPRDGADLPLADLEAQLLHEFGIYTGSLLHETFTLSQGDDARDRTDAYDAYIRAMLRGGMWQLCDAYPVLARQLAVIVETWVASTVELCVRLSNDRRDIEAVFCDGRPAGTIVAIEPALSDPHDGRRRVASLRFSSGLRIVYKPRSLAVESAFVGVLEWARAAGLAPVQRALRLLPRASYGWVEYAEAANAFTNEQARGYYEQAGGLLCWAHVLRGRDLHMENVVATSTGPVLIDLEVLIQPVRTDDAPASPVSAPPVLLQPGEVSCLETGLLTMLENRDDGETMDVGGFRGTPLSVASRAVRVWRHLRSSAITAVNEPAPPVHVANAVVVDGQRTRPEMYLTEFVAGFTATYRFIMANRETLLSADGPLRAVRGSRVRLLPRHTRQYGQLIQALNAPRYQRDGAVRSVWFDIFARPHAAAQARPAVWPLLTAEQRLMGQLDVPRFWSPADGTTIFAGDDAVMDGYVAMSGLEAVRRQIASLSEADLDAQRARLGASLSETVDARFTHRIDGVPEAPDSDEAVRTLKSAALVIGEELLERGIAQRPRGAPLSGVQAHALYRGRLGLPVFFAALAAVTGDDRWRAAAESAVEPVLAFVHDGPRLHNPGPIGVCAGWGSLTYGLGLMGRLLHAPSYWAAAGAAAARITSDAAVPDGPPDVTDGWAGAILALVSLYRHTGDPALLAHAERCAARLLEAERLMPAGSVWPLADGRAFVGFAHGCAGIGTAFLSLADATMAERWLAPALRAWKTVESAFLPPVGNWPVEVSNRSQVSTMTAWCHGSPGILIGLSRALDFGHESAILAHATTALTMLQRVPDHREEHLCCGNLGRAEALFVYGSRIGAPSVIDNARGWGLRVVARAARRQHVRLSANGFEYPGVRSGVLPRSVGHRLSIAPAGHASDGSVGAGVRVRGR